MAIAKGQDWGDDAPLPTDLVVVGDDHEARAVVSAALADGGPLPAVGLTGGDLWRTLGGRPGDEASLRASHAMVTIDLIKVRLDGESHVFLSHLVARRSWFAGRVVVAMNAQYLGDWDVAPRAHPGDGLVDVLDVTMGFGDRWKARSRLRSGTHVPHPDIAQRRTAHWSVELARPLTVRLDGDHVGSASTIEMDVEPDRLRVLVPLGGTG